MTPDSENLKKLLEKINRLLALSASANEHEAMRAAERAAELMARYSISLADVQVGVSASEEEITDTVVQSFSGDETIPWRRTLLLNIGSSIGCLGKVTFDGDLIEDARGRERWKVDARYFRLIGPSHLVAQAAALYEYLTETIERLAAEAMEAEQAQYPIRKAARQLPESYYAIPDSWSLADFKDWQAGQEISKPGEIRVKRLNPKTFKREFYTACVSRVCRRLYEKHTSMREQGLPATEDGPSISGIVLASSYALARQRAEDYYNRMYAGESVAFRGRSQRTYDALGAAHGYAAGDRIGLDPQLPAEPAQPTRPPSLLSEKVS